MTTYTPEPRDRVHLTLEAVVESDGHYRVDTRTDSQVASGTRACRGSTWIHSGARGVVKVEPAPRPLPTEAGSLIVARVPSFARGALVLERVADRPVAVWSVVGTREWVDAADIAKGWVQIDPETLRPMEGTS